MGGVALNLLPAYENPSFGQEYLRYAGKPRAGILSHTPDMDPKTNFSKVHTLIPIELCSSYTAVIEGQDAFLHLASVECEGKLNGWVCIPQD